MLGQAAGLYIYIPGSSSLPYMFVKKNRLSSALSPICEVPQRHHGHPKQRPQQAGHTQLSHEHPAYGDAHGLHPGRQRGSERLRRKSGEREDAVRYTGEGCCKPRSQGGYISTKLDAHHLHTYTVRNRPGEPVLTAPSLFRERLRLT